MRFITGCLQLLTYLEVALRHAGGSLETPSRRNAYFRSKPGAQPKAVVRGRNTPELRKRFRLKGLVLNDLNLLNLMETGLPAIFDPPDCKLS